jgi:hypothetical protein
MHLALVAVPDLAARFRKHRLYREQEPHLLRLEDATVRSLSKIKPSFNSVAVR